MQINVVYKGTRHAINVSTTQQIRHLKEKLSELLHLDFHISSQYDIYDEGSKDGKYALYYNGYLLNDNCTMTEVGLVPGSTIRCRQIRVAPHVLKIHVPALCKEIILKDEISIKENSVGELRSILQNIIGIPISTFIVRQLNRRDIEMYDNNYLDYYDVKHGDVLIVTIWDDMKKLILYALDEDISKTFTQIPNFHDDPAINRYYLRVVLFITAHFDLAKLATQVLDFGVQCDDAVGEYPSRQWCFEQSHFDVLKTPVHQAATKGSYRTLNIFLRHNPAMVVVKDGFGRTPSMYAMMNQNIECWKFLLVAQFKFRNKCGFSLYVYSKVMKWCHKAKERVLYFKVESKNQSLLLSQSKQYGQISLGNPMIVNGYHDEYVNKEKNKSISKVSAWSSNMQQAGKYRNKSFNTKTEKKKNDFDEIQELPSSSNSKKENFPNVTRSEISFKKNGSELNPSTSSNQYRNSSVDSRKISKKTPQMEAKKLIYKLTGKSSWEIAAECFRIGQTFDRMSWTSQMKIALKCSENFVDRNMKN